MNGSRKGNVTTQKGIKSPTVYDKHIKNNQGECLRYSRRTVIIGVVTYLPRNRYEQLMDQ